ncbi:MAG: SBBP repeat-containing protein, partial [Blastocatellia bacterium]
FLTSTEAVALLGRGKAGSNQTRAGKRSPVGSASDAAPAALRMSLVGGATQSEATGLDELRGKSNYFMGGSPDKWRTDVPLFARVQYKAVYPGIDLVYHGNQRQLEYDFVVAPGADPAPIGLSFEGARKMRIDGNGDLVLKTTAGEFRQHKPVIYQEVEGVKQEIKGRYVLKSRNEVGFKVAAYDHSKALIIDPVLAYGSYLGGSLDDVANGIAVDANGYAYVTGTTNSATFPAKDAFQSDISHFVPEPAPTNPWKGKDAFVSKFDPSKTGGDSLVYSTFLGGSGNEEANGIAVDAAGNAYVTGTTWSVDLSQTPWIEPEFPTANAFRAHLNAAGLQYPEACYCSDAFVAKLGAGGNTLLYSTYFGGSGTDFGQGIAVDSFGNAYVIGTSYHEFTSNSDYWFPLREAFMSTHTDQDAFVAKFATSQSGDASLVFSTILGGGPNRGDLGFGIAVTPSGDHIYVTGGTAAPNFPTKNAYQPEIGQTYSAFVTVFNDTRPLTLLYSTFLHSTAAVASEGKAVAVDSSGNAYVTGRGGYPFVTRNPIPNSVAAGPFVTKINPFLAGNASLIYSTCLSNIVTGQTGWGIAVDANGSAYVAVDPDRACLLEKNRIQGFGGGIRDAYVAKLNPSGDDLVYATYIGGSDEDAARGVAIDAAGNAYVAGYTRSTNFPTTPGAFCGTKPPSEDVWAHDLFVVKVAEKQANLAITMTTAPDPVVTGTQLTYTMSVTNLGPDTADSVIVTDQLEQEVFFVSSNPPASVSGSNVIVNLGSIAPGASSTVEIVALVSCLMGDGKTITNTAMVTSLTYDPDTGNNSETAGNLAYNPPPDITCPPDVLSSSALVYYDNPTASDNCDRLIRTVCSPPSGSRFPVGTTLVACYANDDQGQTSRCTFTVTVAPKTPW